MPFPSSHPIDVVVAGAGPVGLFLACELGQAGLSVTVLEQAGDPHSPLKRLPLGMRGLSVSTIEAFYRRGMLDALERAQRENERSGATRAAAHWAREERRSGGHFAGIPIFLDQVDTERWRHHLPGRTGYHLMADIASLESVLAARAAALGVHIRRGVQVTGVEQSEHGVTVQAGGAALAARWLVGCDGGRSAVRKFAGFEFLGTEPEFTGYSLDVELDDPGVLRPGRTYTPQGMYTFAPPGTIAMVDFDGGAFHRGQPVTREHVQKILRRVSGTDVAVIAVRQATTWTDRARQASEYRKGRVLLAGDAAHIHSPLGGQGLNLGIGDAMNLGWKLAATVRGTASAGLLDSYEQERHPVGAKVLDWSRAQVALIRPSPAARALEAIVRDLIGTRDGATYVAERVWGLSLRYDLGGSHPLVGRSVPDFVFADGSTTGALLEGGQGLWLDFDMRAPARALASRWDRRIRYAVGEVKDGLGLAGVLVRPDGIVSWAGEQGAPLSEAEAAAQRWFGDG